MNRICGLAAIAWSFFLSSGENARAATYFEDFPTGSHADPATNYGFTQLAGGGSHVRFGMQIDPSGLALFGGGAWAQWNVVGIDTGVTAEPGMVTVFSCDASASPPADGAGGTDSTSHWGFFSINNAVAWGGVKWGVSDSDAISPQHGWVFEPGHVTGGAEAHYIPGYLGTYDNGEQELTVRLEVWVDRVNFEIWGTIDDGVTRTVTPKYVMAQNQDLHAVITGGLTANTGSQTAEGIDVDNITASTVESSPLEFMDIAAEDTPGVQFQSGLNQTYRFEYAAPPAPNTWFETGATMTGDGNMMTFFDPSGPSATRLYRVMREQ
jgi:hypothetical protein